MILTSFQVKNFKCFRDTGNIELNNGFNVFVGQNNSGKTTLLEALRLEVFNRSHKSAASKIGQALNPISTLEVSFRFSGEELRDFGLIRGHQIAFATPNYQAMPLNNATGLLHDMFSQESLSVSGRFQSDTGWISKHSSFLQPELPMDGAIFARFNPNSTRRNYEAYDVISNGSESIFNIISEYFMMSTFRFLPQRLVASSSQFASERMLASDGANLPRALFELYKTPILFERLIDHMNSIFPSIKWINVEGSDQSPQEIRVSVSAYGREIARPDLLMPLSECGTGVGQVLAILLAALSFQTSKIILIDEPNSFLHPSAAKRLIEILRQYDHHQYILTTHSAEIIVSAEPATLHHTKWTGTESIVENLSGGDVRKTQLALADIGVQISDVFGANEILWVEGQTEQMCFPKLIEVSEDSKFRNAKVLALKSTSEIDHSRPSAKLTREIYITLSQSNALVPRAVGFRLDREGRTDREIDQLEKETGSHLRFLARRNYECYLIHPAAISSLLLGGEFAEAVDASQQSIEDEIRKLGESKEFGFSRYWKGDFNDSIWLKHVDGAKLLQSLFKNLTNSQLEYKKTTHSFALTEWLISNDRAHIRELIEFVS